MNRIKTPFVFSLILIICFASSHADAMWAKSTDAELAADSDIIVRAELIGKTGLKASPDGRSLHLGILKVEKVLKGSTKHTVLLLILPSPDALRKSDDMYYKEGQKGLWLLMRSKENKDLYHGNHPGRFIPEADTDRINKFLNLLKSRTN